MTCNLFRERFSALGLIALCLFAIGWCRSGHAQFIETTLVAEEGGDWFDPSIWDTGFAPSSNSIITIDNGATVELRTDSPFAPQVDPPSYWEVLDVGSGAVEADDTHWSLRSLFLYASDPPHAPSSASFAGDLDVSSSVFVGIRQSGGGGFVNPPNTSALQVGGTLTGGTDYGVFGNSLHVGIGTAAGGAYPRGYTEGVAEVGGSVLGFYAVSVGKAVGNNFSASGSPDWRATGRLAIGGSLEVTVGAAMPPGYVSSYFVDVGVSKASGVAVEGELDVDGDATLDFLNVGQATGHSATGTVHIGGNLGGHQTTIRAGRIDPAYQRGDVPVAAPRQATGTIQIGGDLDILSAYLGSGTTVAESRFDPTDHAYGAIRVRGDLRSVPYPFPDGPGAAGYFGIGRGNAAGNFEGELVAEGTTDLNIGGIGVGTYRSSRIDAGLGTGCVDLAGGSIRGALGEESRFFVGKVDGTGTGQGRFSFAGDMIGFGRTDIGVVEGDGHAQGEVVLRDGSLSTVRARVGVVESGVGTARGALQLVRSRLDVSQELFLGSGAELSIVLDPEEANASLPAVQTGTAVLDGVLELVFEPGVGPGVYDLISAEVPGGLSGMFTRIAVVGIDPALVSFGIASFGGEGVGTDTSGVETASIGTRFVESFQARVVPEPGSALLIGFGLLALASSRKHAGV